MTNWDAGRYQQVSGLQRRLAERALSGFDLTGVQRLLDVGCGDGRITAALAAQLPDAAVVGIEPSPRMISAAPTGERLTFQLGEAQAMPFEDEFDAVVSFNALHWVPDQRGALARIAAALRRPGRALLVFVCAGPRPSVEDVAMAVTSSPRWKERFAYFEAPFVHPDPNAYREQVTAAGLRVAGWDVADLSWDFGSRTAFAEWCTAGFGAWTARLPAPAAVDFVDDVVSAYADITGSAHLFRFMQLTARLAN